MIKLFINNQECDTFPNTIAITRQSYNLSDFSKRFLGRTNNFQLPKTDNNLRIFGEPNLLGSNNLPFEQKYDAKIIDGTTILNGIAILDESSKYYNVQIIDGSKLFFDSLQDDLKDLDFESDDFTYGVAAYNTLKVPTNSVWLWAGYSPHQNAIQANTVLATQDTNKIKFTRPWFNSQIIIDKIFDTHNWLYNNKSEFIEFAQAIISSNHEQFFVTSYQKTLNTTYNLVADTPQLISGLTTYDFLYTSVAYNDYIDIKKQNSQFRLRGNIQLENDLTITIKGISGSSGTNIKNQSFIISKFDTYVDIETSIFKINDTENANNISIELLGEGSVIFENTLLYDIIEEESLGDFKDNNLIGYRIKAHDNMPDMTQLDLIVKNYMPMFGAAFNTDPFSNTLNIFGFDLINNLNNYKWSGKYIRETASITGSAGNYAQINYLSYDNDEFTPINVGRGVFTIDNENLIPKNDLIKLNFSASNEIVINDYTLLDMPVYTDFERNGTANVRIGQWYYDDTSTFTLIDFKALNWDLLLNKYYSRIIASLKRQRFITAEFDLNKLDVVGFDFQKCVYVEYAKSHFLVMAIGDYIPGTPTQCELLKLE